MKTLKRLCIDKGSSGLARSLSITPWVRFPERSLLPRHQVEPLEEGNRFTWRATGNDPQLYTRKRLPLPGWHMLEVAMEHDQPSVAVRLYMNFGEGFKQEQSVYLPLKSGRITKRLFYVSKKLKAIRFDPMEQAGNFSISYLRIAWLTPWFAHDRLAQRLANMHHAWRTMGKPDVLPALKKKAEEQGCHWRDIALSDYEETFERVTARRSYRQWLENHKTLGPDKVQRVIEKLPNKPLISILMPVYNPRVEWLRECLNSVVAQQYSHWQLCIADDASTDPRVHEVLSSFAESDSRIQVVYRPRNGHICAASNSALALAKGEYLALLDHDDCLSPRALFRVAEALHRHPEAVVLYSDEDKLNENGERYDPHFKAQWNPDLLLAQNYVSHLGVYRSDRVKEVGGFREGYEGSQDHDLVLRCTAGLGADRVIHIPHVLYHWRAGKGSTALSNQQKDYTSEAGLRAVQSALAVTYPQARAMHGSLPNTYRVVWPLPDSTPKVTLLVPTRDRVEILKPCVDAILERTDYPDLELLILDNDSECEETLAYMKEVEQRDARVRVLRWNQPFNYSAINNFGAAHAQGEILALVNNDIEPINPDWLREMVSHACRPEIGCVGAKLYYPNDTVQHGGVILGVGGVAGHAHKYFSRNSPGYFSRLFLTQNLSAVTAACLMVRKSVFDELNGLNETDLPIAFNDVDLCLRVREAGYRNLWTPHAELYHHESISRGADNNSQKRARALGEATYMRRTWGDKLDHDPAYNPNLTLVHEDFSLR